jgi:hypothetical protein
MAVPVEQNVLDLYLDSENPRHESINDQAEIIKHLLKNEHVKHLARDIAEHGLSPIEQFAVIKDKTGHYIVLEGNRRLCALLLLNDPDKAPEGERTYFKNLIKGKQNFPSIAPCIEFDNREAADIWVERRHEGAQDGIGTRQWDASQKSRHNTSRSKSDRNALALALIDHAIKSGFIPEEKRIGLITTATRYLSNPLFRKTIGVTSANTNSEIVINVTYDEFNRVIERFSEDLLDPSSAVSSRSNKKDRENYARQLITDGAAPAKHGKPLKLADEKDQKKPTPSGGNNNGTTGGRNNQNPDNRKSVLPASFKANIKNKNIKRMFDELRTLDAETYALASSFLCRAFLENIYDLFYEKLYTKPPPEKTHLVMLEIIKKIEPGKSTLLSVSERKAFGFFKKLPTGEKYELNPSNLGANAHGNHYPKAIELKREWDNVEAFILHMIDKI